MRNFPVINIYEGRNLKYIKKNKRYKYEGNVILVGKDDLIKIYAQKEEALTKCRYDLF